MREAIEVITQKVTIDNVGERETEEKLFLIREKIEAGHISSHIQEELTSKLKNIGILEKLDVRSSATAEDAAGVSFAGIHESFLNVRGMDNNLSNQSLKYANRYQRYDSH